MKLRKFRPRPPFVWLPPTPSITSFVPTPGTLIFHSFTSISSHSTKYRLRVCSHSLNNRASNPPVLPSSGSSPTAARNSGLSSFLPARANCSRAFHADQRAHSATIALIRLSLKSKTHRTSANMPDVSKLFLALSHAVAPYPCQ